MGFGIQNYYNYHNYFDITHFCVVDPMHNLFKGSACHFMDLTLEKGLLAKNALAVVEQRTVAIKSP